MTDISDIDFESLSKEDVLAEIKKDSEAKGSLAITDLANESVPHSKLLTAIEETIGEAPFEHVMKASYEDRLADVVVKSNPDVLSAGLPQEIVNKIQAYATKLRREEVSARNPEFQAYKHLVVSELCRAMLAESGGRVQVKWDKAFGTNFKFTHAHTSEAKKAAIEEQRAEREAKQSGGKRLGGMRSKFKRKRG